MTTPIIDRSWDTFTTRKEIRGKLADAEVRLNSTVYELLLRWLSAGITVSYISTKLDISYSTTIKLLTFFELQDRAVANRQTYLKKRDAFTPAIARKAL